MWQTSRGRVDRIIVFADNNGSPVPMGELSVEGRGRIRSSTFRYARSWFAEGHAIDPTHLPLRREAFRNDPSLSELPLPFLDAAPDGWGRRILKGAFPDQDFGDAEFLVASGDERVGELRFGPSPQELPQRWVPPGRPMLTIPSDLDTLEELQAAAAAVDTGEATERHLALLFRKSGDLGGARPKATIWRDGMPWIAKFRAQDDAWDDPRVEAVCLGLARACLIEVPDHELITVKGRSVLLIRRFDRGEAGARLGYSSAATMMGLPNTGYATDATYASLAAKARQQGVVPCETDLFRRMLFNCFVHNTDDHLRNHGFIRDGGRWRLSPAFDITLNRARRLVMAPAKSVSPLPDPVVAFAAHPAFGLSRTDALLVYEEVVAGLAEAEDMLDLHHVSITDSSVLTESWQHVFNPPPESDLVTGTLVRPSRDPGGDPAARLEELGITFDPQTHVVKKAGRGIVIHRIATGKLDNAPGIPARVRNAWGEEPQFDFFEDGVAVSATVEPGPTPRP